MKWLTYWTATFALAATMGGAGAAERHFGPPTSMAPRSQTPALRQGARPAVNARAVAERVAKLRRARDVLRRQAAAPLPRALSPSERAEAERYNAWLRRSAKRLGALANRGDTVVRMASESRQDAAAERRMQEMNHSFNLQYLQLQQKMQADNRRFTLMSNIMKTKHDTAKNAINNIR